MQCVSTYDGIRHAPLQVFAYTRVTIKNRDGQRLNGAVKHIRSAGAQIQYAQGVIQGEFLLQDADPLLSGRLSAEKHVYLLQLPERPVHPLILNGEVIHDFGIVAASQHALRRAVSIVSPGPKATAQIRSSFFKVEVFRISFRTKRMEAEERFP